MFEIRQQLKLTVVNRSVQSAQREQLEMFRRDAGLSRDGQLIIHISERARGKFRVTGNTISASSFLQQLRLYRRFCARVDT
jgi:hypothetical protein